MHEIATGIFGKKDFDPKNRFMAFFLVCGVW
jgi:hypothetical protein